MKRYRLAPAFFGVLLFLSAPAFAQDSESCGVCHRSVHKDWLQSRHSQSWKSEEFQAQMKRFGSTEFCGRCHAPQSIWQQVNLRPEKALLSAPDPDSEPQEYTPELRDVPEARSDGLDDGVNCNSCHFVEVLWPTGKSDEFLGPYHSEVGHGGKKASAFESFQFCGSCHGRAAADYRPEGASNLDGFHHLQTAPLAFAVGSSDCGRCHMPRREEKLVQLSVFKTAPLRKVGEHTFSGNRYEELAESLALSLETDQGGPVLVVRNDGVGHPPKTSADTGYRLVIRWRGQTQTAELEGADRLQPGQSLHIPLDFDPHGGSVEVELRRTTAAGFEEALFTRTL